MAILNNILGYRDFSPIEVIKDFISRNLPSEPSENIGSAKELLLFETTRQKTWLLVSNLRLFCILDDIAKDTFEVRWVMKKSEIIEAGKIILPIAVHPEYKENTGLIDFGEKQKDWLFSKSLFSTAAKLKSAIEDLIVAQMK